MSEFSNQLSFEAAQEPPADIRQILAGLDELRLSQAPHAIIRQGAAGCPLVVDTVFEQEREILVEEFGPAMNDLRHYLTIFASRRPGVEPEATLAIGRDTELDMQCYEFEEAKAGRDFGYERYALYDAQGKRQAVAHKLSNGIGDFDDQLWIYEEQFADRPVRYEWLTVTDETLTVLEPELQAFFKTGFNDELSMVRLDNLYEKFIRQQPVSKAEIHALFASYYAEGHGPVIDSFVSRLAEMAHVALYGRELGVDMMPNTAPSAAELAPFIESLRRIGQ